MKGAKHFSWNLQGKNWIPKTGRSSLRRVRGYILRPLLQKKKLRGTATHAKKESGMPGNQALLTMIHKFLGMV